jgi:hypothetical protein
MSITSFQSTWQPTVKEIWQAIDDVPEGECCDVAFFKGNRVHIIHVDKSVEKEQSEQVSK